MPEDIRGWEQIGYDKESHLTHGRECSICKKKQYLVLNWISLTHKDIIK